MYEGRSKSFQPQVLLERIMNNRFSTLTSNLLSRFIIKCGFINLNFCLSWSNSFDLSLYLTWAAFLIFISEKMYSTLCFFKFWNRKNSLHDRHGLPNSYVTNSLKPQSRMAACETCAFVEWHVVPQQQRHFCQYSPHFLRDNIMYLHQLGVICNSTCSFRRHIIPSSDWQPEFVLSCSLHHCRIIRAGIRRASILHILSQKFHIKMKRDFGSFIFFRVSHKANDPQ